MLPRLLQCAIGWHGRLGGCTAGGLRWDDGAVWQLPISWGRLVSWHSCCKRGHEPHALLLQLWLCGQQRSGAGLLLA